VSIASLKPLRLVFNEPSTEAAATATTEKEEEEDDRQ
jgi:hypothetical protein